MRATTVVRRLVAAAALVSFTAALPASAQADSETKKLTFVLTGDMGGDLARFDCSDRKRDDLRFARQVAAARAEGGAEPIAVDVGDLLFPGALLGYLFTDGHAHAPLLGALAKQMGYVTVGLGNRDLALSDVERPVWTKLASDAGLAFGAANAKCVKGKEGCFGAATAPFRVVERSGIKVAIAVVLSPQASEKVRAERLSSLQLADPIEEMRALVPQMRKEADLVVLVYHAAGAGSAMRVRELTSAVEGIDLVVTNEPFEEGSKAARDDKASAARAGLVISPLTNTAIVGADTGSGEVAVVGAEVTRRDGRLVMRNLEAHRVRAKVPEEETAKLLNQAGDAFCAHWGQPLAAEAKPAEPLTFAGMETLVLSSVRHAAKAEIALVNGRAFRIQRNYPLAGAPTRADLLGLAPFGNVAYRARVTGLTLSGLVPLLGKELLAVGLTADELGVIKVNGRDLNLTRLYDIVTTDFVVEGGDGLIATELLTDVHPLEVPWQTEAPTLGDLGAHAIASGEAARPLSPTGSFPDLSRRFLWRFGAETNASVNRVMVLNPDGPEGPAYPPSELNVGGLTQINLEARGVVSADSALHGWDTELLLAFGTQQEDVEGGIFTPNRDAIRARSAYKATLLKADWRDAWYTPIPFAEGQLNTQFVKPEALDWHRLELVGSGGAMFQLFAPLEVRLGMNVRHDVNRPDGTPTWGFVGGWRLVRTPLFLVGTTSIELESDLEYFFNDIGSQDIQQLRNTERLLVGLMDRLSLSASFSAVLYRTSAVGVWGHNLTFDVGLNVNYEAVVQSF
jgi:2',3'-cyclic-nucleotide 2'-phosphodiesterase (5'-nucleotidase family)